MLYRNRRAVTVRDGMQCCGCTCIQNIQIDGARATRTRAFSRPSLLEGMQRMPCHACTHTSESTRQKTTHRRLAKFPHVPVTWLANEPRGAKVGELAVLDFSTQTSLFLKPACSLLRSRVVSLSLILSVLSVEMPKNLSCCTVNCRSRKSKVGCEEVTFYCIPKEEETRRIWLARIHRSDLSERDITKNTRLCSLHFL